MKITFAMICSSILLCGSAFAFESPDFDLSGVFATDGPGQQRPNPKQNPKQNSDDKVAQLLEVTSDAAQGLLEIQLDLDANSSATGFRYVSPKKTKDFELAGLPDGIVIMNYSGYDVVTLKSDDFDPAHGGNIDIICLNNGVTGAHKTYPIEVVRTGDTWQIMVNDKAGHHVVTSAFFKANHFLGQIVGIERVDFK